MTEKMHYCILILYVPIEINDEKHSACAEQNTTYYEILEYASNAAFRMSKYHF